MYEYNVVIQRWVDGDTVGVDDGAALGPTVGPVVGAYAGNISVHQEAVRAGEGDGSSC